MKGQLIAVVALLGACAPPVEGSHRVIEEQRAVAEFNALSVSEGIHAKVRTGELAVTVVGDDNLLPFVITEVVDGVLQVRVGEWISPSRPIQVKVAAPRLDRAASHGANVTFGP